MEHIDWLVSFTIFLFVILSVMIAIPRYLPEITDREDIQASSIVFSTLTENIESYKFIISNDNNIHTYFLEIDNNRGRANTNYVLDNNVVYGIINKKAKFFDFNSNQITTKTLLLEENFFDENNLRYFKKNSGFIINFQGEPYLLEDTEIETKQNYSDFIAEYIIEPRDVNIYFNYIDFENYSLCQLQEDSLRLYDRTSLGEVLIGEVNDLVLDNNFWINIKFGSNFSGNAFCQIKESIIDNDSQNSIHDGKIVLKNKDEQYVSNLKLYYDNHLKRTNNNIQTRYLDVNSINNSLSIKLFDENRLGLGDFNLNFNQDLIYDHINDNRPGILKNASQEHKFIVFPNINEFIIVNENEDINFLSSDFKINYYDYEIENDGNIYLWIKTDVLEDEIKSIYLKKIEGFEPENSFAKDYNSISHPNISVTDLLNGYYEIEIDNSGNEELIDYEIRISNDIISLGSINESLHITDKIYSLEENIVLLNKNNNKYLLFDFFDINNNKTECDISLVDYGFTLNCSNKTYIKIRSSEQITSYPRIIKTKSKDKIITYEKTQNYTPEGYYINIYNNKENISIGEERSIGNLSIFERITTYLNENGEEEIVKVIIKPN
jgi:hypothetical protein